MSAINHGGPAFPIHLLEGERYQGHVLQDGMTLRDYFAAQCMVNIQAVDPDGRMGPTIRAKAAYIQADAMLLAREE